MGAACLVIPLPRHTVRLDIAHPNGTVPLLGGGFRHVGKSGLGPGSRFKASVCSNHSGSLLIEHKLDTCNTISDTICLLDDDGTYQRTTEESPDRDGVVKKQYAGTRYREDAFRSGTDGGSSLASGNFCACLKKKVAPSSQRAHL
jgi:hypothetical protein